MVIKFQSKINQEKAILEDPTVYQYDEIYDDMTSKKEKIKLKTKEQKAPQYIENLMKAASKRKIENERRVERQVCIVNWRLFKLVIFYCGQYILV